MEQLLARFVTLDAGPTQLLTLLIDTLRPTNPSDLDAARRSLQTLCNTLDHHPDLRAALRNQLIALSKRNRHSELYTTTGILPNTGFLSEYFRRIGHKFLPESVDRTLLRSSLRRAFRKTSDGQWVLGVGEDSWLRLIEAIRFDEHIASAEMPHPLTEMLRSLRVLSYWIAALGMDPELLRLELGLETYESPFVTQNQELMTYIAAYPEAWRNPDIIISDDKHLRVLLDQCLDVIDRIRRRAAREGTSIRLTYNLQRLDQLIIRSEQLLDILDRLHSNPDGETAAAPIVHLFTQLISEECQHDNLGVHWRRNTELIALRITKNSSRHGDHYIADSRKEYGRIGRSAAIGGLVIGSLSISKLLLANLDAAPLNAAVLNCINYGLCFCLIHFMHGTVSTKQPAMTANAIASAISKNGTRLGDLQELTTLIAHTFSSQIIAIVGNILVAIPTAALLTATLLALPLPAFIDAAHAQALIEEQSPIHGGALFYAAITGLWLFCSGIISGYFDNYATYNHIPTRIRQVIWLQRLLGKRRHRFLAHYVGKHLGALMGSLALGVFLGMTTFIGLLTDLPIDSRHVAFSSAFLGVAMTTLGPALDYKMLAWAASGIVVIGATNLIVSFALALNVALRARQVAGKPWRIIAKAVLKRLWRNPRDFFLPPRLKD